MKFFFIKRNDSTLTVGLYTKIRLTETRDVNALTDTVDSSFNDNSSQNLLQSSSIRTHNTSYTAKNLIYSTMVMNVTQNGRKV